MSTTFLDDDAGFIRWRVTHPRGFIVNHDREPKPTYLKLHRATCSTFQSVSRGDTWTKVYTKTCSGDLQDLRRWAATFGGELDPCAFCSPVIAD